MSRRKEAQSRMLEAQCRDPRVNSFGFLAGDEFRSDDAPSTPIGINGYFWFADFRSMRNAICHVLPYNYLHPTQPESEASDAINKLSASFLGYKREDIDEEQLLTLDKELTSVTLGKELAFFSENLSLSWVGRFEELATGDTAHARDEREQFRELHYCMQSPPPKTADDGDAPVVTKEELKEFADWMSEACEWRYASEI